MAISQLCAGLEAAYDEAKLRQLERLLRLEAEAEIECHIQLNRLAELEAEAAEEREAGKCAIHARIHRSKIQNNSLIIEIRSFFSALCKKRNCTPSCRVNTACSSARRRST